MTKKVAFFDIDGTVFRSSLLIELVQKLVEEKHFPLETEDTYKKEFESWLNREGSYEEYIGSVVRAFYTHIKGVHYGDVADIGKVVVQNHSKQVYRYTRDLIRELKEKNYFVVAISQSPKAILDEFCNNYGFDKVYGRMYAIGPGDCFTGEVIDEHVIQNKANIVARVLEREDVTLEDSVGVGDTEGDIQLLQEVDQPICFNPNQTLYKHAKRAGWKVVVERKDVIYEL